MYKTLVNTGINNQPQLVIPGFLNQSRVWRIIHCLPIFSWMHGSLPNFECIVPSMLAIQKNKKHHSFWRNFPSNEKTQNWKATTNEPWKKPGKCFPIESWLFNRAYRDPYNDCFITPPYNRAVFHPQQITLSNQKLALQISLSWRPPPSVFDRIDREPATPLVQGGPKNHRYKLGCKPI